MGPGIARRVQDRAHPCRAGRRQVDPRHGSGLDLRRPQPHRRRTDGDRQPPGHQGTRGSRGLRGEAAADHALPRHLRRQHAERQPARRRQRQRLPPGRLRALPGDRRPQGPGDALRDQEHELDALHPAGDRVRGAAADRHSRGWRAGARRRPGSTTPTAARPGRCVRRRRRTTTATSPTPTCCRSRSSRPGWTTSRPRCRSCRTRRRRGSWPTTA